MLNEKILVGDRIVDEEGFTYDVVAASESEIVAKTDYGRDPLPGEYEFVIFSNTSGVWADRDQPEPQVKIVEIF